MKPIVAILAGHHGIGTGASYHNEDEWTLAWEDKLALYLELAKDNLLHPVMEPVSEDDNPREKAPIVRSVRWALSTKCNAAIDLHYNSWNTTAPSGHCIVSSKLTPFVEEMKRALDTLPNKSRPTIINREFMFPRLMEPTPACIIEPAFIFEMVVESPQWRPMLVAALKQGLYKFFEVQHD